MIRPLILLALLPLTLAAKRDDPFAGRIAGKPVQCINPSSDVGPVIIDQRTILYRGTTGGRMWRTGPVGPCPSLRPFTTLIIQRFGGQLCHNDRFQVLEPNSSIPSAFCRFDRFTPYDRPPKR